MSARVTKSLVLFVLLLIFTYVSFGVEAREVSDVRVAKKSVTCTEDPRFITAHRHAGDTDADFFLHNNGVYFRDVEADLEIVSETAIEGEGQDFKFNTKDNLVIPAGSSILLGVTVFQKALPQHKFYRVPALSPPYLADETFELLARIVAYDDWFEGDLIEELYPEGQFGYGLAGFGYRANKKIGSGFDFQAVGLASHITFTVRIHWYEADGITPIETTCMPVTIYDLDRPPVLVIRGTKELGDWYTNADPSGVGYTQFFQNYNDVETWLRTVSDPEQGAFGYRPHITGHSLGGALTQWIAAAYTFNFSGDNGKLGQLVTFNSPGISKDVGAGLGAAYFNKSSANAVTHYVTSADIVSMAGSKYLPAAANGNLVRPNWVKFSYEAGIDKLVDITNKHSVPVITDEIYKDGEWLVNPINGQNKGKVKEYEDIDWLNSGFFTYLPDPDYFAWQVEIVRSAPKVFAVPASFVAAATTFRGTAERVRKELGAVLHFPANVGANMIPVRSAARKWRAKVYESIIKMMQKIAPPETNGNLPLQKAGSVGATAGQVTNFLEAAAQWPQEAWEMSEFWPDGTSGHAFSAWEAMENWTAGQWAATVVSSFDWQATRFWIEDDWRNLEPIPSWKIEGHVYEDKNANGTQNSDEPGMAGQIVYLDSTRNFKLDAGEAFGVTTGDGSYTLETIVADGTYYLRQYIDETTWQLTFPPGGEHEVTLDANANPNREIKGKDFGNNCLTDCGGDGDPPTIPDAIETIIIDAHSILVKVSGFAADTHFNTEISTDDYVCGVVGFAATGGDIYEWSFFGHPVVGAYIYPKDTTWFLTADFLTGEQKGDWFFGHRREEKSPEKWDIDILCISTDIAALNDRDPDKPIFRKRYTNLGDNVGVKSIKDTGFKVSEYACGVVGFEADDADINEKGTGNIIQTYLYPNNGTWHIRADLRSHNYNEDWDIDILCISTALASVDGPLPGKPYFLKEYKRLGDNVRFNTGIKTSDYVCGVVGFAALDGDIDEHKKGKDANLFSVYTYLNNDTWHIRADFRTHKNHENWNVNLLCVARQGFVPRLNVSSEEFGIQNCMGSNMRCQVLTDEFVDLVGFVSVSGGGYSGNPPGKSYRCGGPEYIEVYINDRDAGTGKPTWSWPNVCLQHGQSINLLRGQTYDFRGVSVVGGTPVSFELQPGAALAPVLQGVEPKLFPKPYGSGVALTWQPTVSPNARYYEIQYSEDGGTTWTVYTRSRDISHGGWMNHHGNLACGDGFTRCLKSSQQYTYRVRVLDSVRLPISNWSNVLSAVSMDWADLPPPQQPPTITVPSFVAKYWKETITFTVKATDVNGDHMQILVGGLPSGATLSPTTGTGSVTATFTWRATASDIGDHQVTFTAKDSRGATSSPKTTTITVCEDPKNCLL